MYKKYLHLQESVDRITHKRLTRLINHARRKVMLINPYLLRDFSDIALKGRLLSNRLNQELSFVAFYTRGTEVKSQGIYISNEEDSVHFPTTNRKCCLIVNGMPGERQLQSNIDILYTEKKLDVFQLFNEVSRLLSFFNQLEQDLFHCLIEEHPIQEMLDICQPVLRNPIAVYTTSFQVVCFSERKKAPSLMLFKPEDLHTYSSDEDIDLLTTHPKFLESLKYTTPMVFPDDLTNYRMLYQNIRQNGENIARLLSLETESPIRDGDYVVLLMLSWFITKAFERLYTPELITKHVGICRLIEALIRGKAPEDDIKDVLDRYHWKKEDTYFVYCIDSYRDVKMGSLASTCARLETMIPFSITTVIDDRIAFVINLNASGMTREDVNSRVVFLLREIIIKAGISTEFDGIEKLQDYYKQAQCALEIGKKTDPEIWTYRFENYRMAYLAEKALSELSWRALCEPGLLRLMDYDKEKERDYCRTLRVYLECNMNAAETIKQLFMHRQTFLYQLKNIEKISGLELKNKDIRLSLMNSFRLIDYCQDGEH